MLTYTEVDSASDITLTKPNIVVNTMRLDANSYVYKDFGVDYFGDFEVQFDYQITATSSDNAQAMLWAVTNIPGTMQDLRDNDDSIFIQFFRQAVNGLLIALEINGNVADTFIFGGTTLATRYFTIKRVKTLVTVDVYSDSNRSTLVTTVSGFGTFDGYRYHQVIGSRDFTGGSDTMSLSGGKFYIASVSPESSSSSSSTSGI